MKARSPRFTSKLAIERRATARRTATWTWRPQWWRANGFSRTRTENRIDHGQRMHIHIKNGRLVDPKNGVDAKQDVFLVDGKVASIGKPPAGFKAGRTLDASGLVVAPGLV